MYDAKGRQEYAEYFSHIDRYNLFTLKGILPSIGSILRIFLNSTYEQKVTVLT